MEKLKSRSQIRLMDSVQRSFIMNRKSETKNKIMTTRWVLMILLGMTLVGSIGCRHTAEGFGRDMERTGEKIQDKTR